MQLRIFFIFIGIIGFEASCATAPPQKTVSQEELVRQDNVLGLQLAQMFETHLKLKQDSDVSVYLRRVAQTLAESTAELKAAPVGVLTLRDLSGKWLNFGLPGNRVYLSIGLLKTIQFENELAAAIALQFGHIIKRHAIIHLEPKMAESETFTQVQIKGLPRNIDFFAPNGIFNFSLTELFEAIQEAVKILYNSGFDPRGLASIWMKYMDNPTKSPFDENTLIKVMEKTRHTIASYSPLRNPIVRSQAFLLIQKRIQKL